MFPAEDANIRSGREARTRHLDGQLSGSLTPCEASPKSHHHDRHSVNRVPSSREGLAFAPRRRRSHRKEERATMLGRKVERETLPLVTSGRLELGQTPCRVIARMDFDPAHPAVSPCRPPNLAIVSEFERLLRPWRHDD